MASLTRKCIPFIRSFIHSSFFYFSLCLPSRSVARCRYCGAIRRTSGTEHLFSCSAQTAVVAPPQEPRERALLHPVTLLVLQEQTIP